MEAQQSLTAEQPPLTHLGKNNRNLGDNTTTKHINAVMS